MPFRSVVLSCAFVALGISAVRAEPSPMQAPSSTVAWHCYRNDVAAVLATEKQDAVGTTFRVRPPTAALKADCEVDPRGTDVVLGATDDDAYYYIALFRSFLILDNGTGPDRALAIHEVPGGRKLLATGYSVKGSCQPTEGCMSDEFSIEERGLTFWGEIDEKPTAKNCKDYASFMKTTGSAAIEEKSVFNFATRKVERSGKKRCTARQ
ncbi:hypothetical protein [Methylobacterium organophilum]|nr:hypothetical protein [Methylobacterium organophilum]